MKSINKYDRTPIKNKSTEAIEITTTKRCFDLTFEKSGASSWLSNLPFAEHGFNLKRAVFRGAMTWTLEDVPEFCV